MASFINENFMLTNKAAEELYHKTAENLPIIDYHCHLDPQLIAENHQFNNLTEVWLGGDHYKWRALRANGVAENYITGKADSFEKFEKWAMTVPATMRNPLYHWTHLELKRIFGTDLILKPENAREIYEHCTALLRTKEFSTREIMRRFKVETVCTTDDPADSLQYHAVIANEMKDIKVFPTWRPDKVMAVENPQLYRMYIEKLGAADGKNISTYSDLLQVLRNRHDFFASMGCRVSDHGIENFMADEVTEAEMTALFAKVIDGKNLNAEEISKFKSGLLFELAVMDWEKDWAQQFHISVVRNANSRMFNLLGPDTGYDAIADVNCSWVGNRFFDSLEKKGKLAKTILYSLNPKDMEVLATMAYSFNDGSVAGKMQLGSGWWFLDQEDGMRKQINALSSLGLLSRFIGMLTDSRSFLSYPRHEYFRRILCSVIGEDIESGRLPESEMDYIHKMVGDICYYNAKQYFNF